MKPCAPIAARRKEKNIAKTGIKTISYVAGPSMSTCTFNYSDDEKLNDGVGFSGDRGDDSDWRQAEA